MDFPLEGCCGVFQFFLSKCIYISICWITRVLQICPFNSKWISWYWSLIYICCCNVVLYIISLPYLHSLPSGVWHSWITCHAGWGHSCHVGARRWMEALPIGWGCVPTCPLGIGWGKYPGNWRETWSIGWHPHRFIPIQHCGKTSSPPKRKMVPRNCLRTSVFNQHDLADMFFPSLKQGIDSPPGFCMKRLPNNQWWT